MTEQTVNATPEAAKAEQIETLKDTLKDIDKREAEEEFKEPEEEDEFEDGLDSGEVDNPPPSPEVQRAQYQAQQLHQQATRQQQALAQQAAQQQQMAQWLQMQAAQLQQAQAPKPPVSDPDDPNFNPIEHYNWELNQLKQKQAYVDQVIQNEVQERQVAQQLRSMRETADTSENQFRAKVPKVQVTDPRTGEVSLVSEYDLALDHFRQSRYHELETIFPGASPDMIGATIDNDEAALVHKAMQAGMQPAEYAYRLAMARGYVPASRRQAPNLPRDDQGRWQRQEGRRYSQNLDSAGRAGSTDIGLKTLANGSPKEVRDIWAQIKANPKHPMRKRLGG